MSRNTPSSAGTLFARRPLADLLAEAEGPGEEVARVVCTGGVSWARAGWLHDPSAPDRWLARTGLRPVVLLGADGSGRLLSQTSPHPRLISGVGALGWRPPIERLAAVGRYEQTALRLRPLLDAGEQHALDAALRYAAASMAAARTARLLGAGSLATVPAPSGLFVAVDALFGAASHTLAAAHGLAERVHGRGLRGAPAMLRAVLAEVRADHAAPAVARRRALHRQAAAGLGPATVRVRRARAGGAVIWVVRVPVGRALGAAGGPAPQRALVDAFDAAWGFVTEAWRALTLAIYSALDEWPMD